MTIQLYNNLSDPRALRKSITAVGSSFTCDITENCSVENPSFIFELDNNKLGANYLYVSEWNKYYYITSHDILNKHEVVLNCHIDVLMSFKNAILNSDIICERSSSNVNKYIPDTACADRGTIQQIFRKCSTTPFSRETKCYVLHIAGKQ